MALMALRGADSTPPRIVFSIGIKALIPGALPAMGNKFPPLWPQSKPKEEFDKLGDPSLVDDIAVPRESLVD